jgi:hypothetical protein
MFTCLSCGATSDRMWIDGDVCSPKCEKKGPSAGPVPMPERTPTFHEFVLPLLPAHYGGTGAEGEVFAGDVTKPLTDSVVARARGLANRMEIEDEPRQWTPVQQVIFVAAQEYWLNWEALAFFAQWRKPATHPEIRAGIFAREIAASVTWYDEKRAMDAAKAATPQRLGDYLGDRYGKKYSD